jgi:hypothetical protein
MRIWHEDKPPAVTCSFYIASNIERCRPLLIIARWAKTCTSGEPRRWNIHRKYLARDREQNPASLQDTKITAPHPNGAKPIAAGLRSRAVSVIEEERDAPLGPLAPQNEAVATDPFRPMSQHSYPRADLLAIMPNYSRKYPYEVIAQRFYLGE